MRKRIAIWIALGLLTIGIGIGVWRWRAASSKQAVVYKGAPVEKKRIVAKVTASGTLSALVTVQVGAQVSGRIQKLNVDFNSPVKKGDLIAALDPELFKAAMEQATANYNQARAGAAKSKAVADLAGKQRTRTKSLHDQGLAAQQDVDAQESAVAQASADVALQTANMEQAMASMNQARVNLSYTNIHSPIDGVVISRNVDVGQTVAASLQAPVLFTIAEDLRKMQVDTNVSEGDVGRLKEGMPAYFTVDAYPGQRFYGKIAQIRNAATNVQNVVTYDAVIKVDNDELKLRPFMTANVTIVYAERESVLTVPNAALRFHPADATTDARKPRKKGDPADDTRTVYVLHGETPTAVAIHAGLSDGTCTEIVDGELHEGDQVAVDTADSSSPAAPKASTTNPLGGGAGAGGGGGGGGGGGRRPF